MSVCTSLSVLGHICITGRNYYTSVTAGFVEIILKQFLILFGINNKKLTNLCLVRYKILQSAH
jgi:hypothetical protein